MERMRQLREEKGISQAQAAVRAGMDPSTWNRLEQGKGNPNIRTLERVADALGVEVADLLGKVRGRSSLEPKLFNNGLEDERPRLRQEHEARVRTYRAATAFGRTVVESFKNFRPLDLQRLAAFHQLASALSTLRGRRDVLGKLPDDLADAIDELEEVTSLVDERLHEHLDTSSPEERQEFERELKELERITA